MIEQFLAYNKTHSLFSEGEKVLLAISGGVDSMVMLDLFKRVSVQIVIAHCNFRLRGSAADKDAAFVQDQALRSGIELYVREFNTKKYAKEKGLSIQMAARELRYTWFLELLSSTRCRSIASAHHKNDTLETVLLNMVRGTGIAGLHGIPVKTNTLIRPLGFATRQMIEDHARANGLQWREDESNKEDKYSRNLIRNQVVPLLKRINPALEHTMEQTIWRLTSVEAAFELQVAQFKKEHAQKIGDDLYFDIVALRTLGAAAPAVLMACLQEYKFNYDQVRAIVQQLDGQAGKVFQSRGHQLNIDRDHLILSQKGEAAPAGPYFIMDRVGEQQTGPWHWDIALCSREVYTFRGHKDIAALDKSLLRFPLEVRRWRSGDRFYPLGMRHKKKMSDFMIDEKIPLNLKDNLMVLCSGKEIAWVIGHRIDNRFKVTDTTHDIFEITRKTKEDDQPL